MFTSNVWTDVFFKGCKGIHIFDDYMTLWKEFLGLGITADLTNGSQPVYAFKTTNTVHKMHRITLIYDDTILTCFSHIYNCTQDFLTINYKNSSS